MFFLLQGALGGRYLLEMPPKKGGKKKGKGKAPPFTPEELQQLVLDYKRNCLEYGVDVSEKLCSALSEDELRDEFTETNQLIISADDTFGPGGARALSTAILGSSTSKPFPGVKSLRIWACMIGDTGAASIAEILRLGGAEVAIDYLELSNNKISIDGCRALGSALMVGGNRSLLKLDLSYNDIGSGGAAALSRGLRSNSSLLQLCLCYCGLDETAAEPIGDALAFAKTSLIHVNLQGNRLGDEGLRLLSGGLERNSSLLELNLNDNRIGSIPNSAALRAMMTFGSCVQMHKSLATLRLDHNALCSEVCDVLWPNLRDPQNSAKQHPRLKLVEVDAGLDVDPDVYAKLSVTGGGGGGKKKGKKKGKK